MIWFTADTHFNHAKIIGYSQRPFGDLAQMTEALIDGWNARVAKGDTVFHLGDFALSWGRKDKDTIDSILVRMNGQKWLIAGNHDRDEVTSNDRWVKVTPYHEISVPLTNGQKQRIVLCHYALRVWNGMGRGSWMLYGHSHGNLDDIGGKTTDVGVDKWDYAPISVEQLAVYMEPRAIVGYDHHCPECDDDGAPS